MADKTNTALPEAVVISSLPIDKAKADGTAKAMLGTNNYDHLAYVSLSARSQKGERNVGTAIIPCPSNAQIDTAIALAKQGKTSATLEAFERYANQLNAKAGHFFDAPQQFSGSQLLESCRSK